jgi:predicted nucleic acid-binding protein
MRYIPKIYLETTIFNFYYVDKDSKKKGDTHKLFDAIKEGTYEVYTSQYVQTEIARDTPEKYKKMQGLLEKYTINIVSFSKEAEYLADVYMANGIIPLKYDTDALHIATATVNKLDFVASFNFGHIVKLKTMIGTGFVNLHHGYRQIGLCTPTEVADRRSVRI